MPSDQPTLGADAVAAMAAQCFRPPDVAPGPEKIGLEFEWLTISARHPDDRLDLAALRTAAADGGDLPGGGTVTFEPGGQLELNSGPAIGLDAACDAAHTDARELSRRMERVGVALVPIGLDAFRPPRRVLTSARYDAMEAAFDAKGPHGRRMMCNTAALQVNVDLGPGDPCIRWRLAHALGPTLVACFANSPFGEEGGTGRPSGWVANRLATWWGIDPSRTAAPVLGDDPADTWLRYALAANVLLIRSDPETIALRQPFSFAQWMTDGHPAGWPTADDFAYHLTTLFPPVRPRQWLELRMLDAVDASIWPVAVAVIVTLLTDPAAAAAATAATAETAGLWSEAAQAGLRHPDLARSADACFAATVEALPRTGTSQGLRDAVGRYADRYVARRRCPADDRLDEWHAVGRLLPEGTSADQQAGVGELIVTRESVAQTLEITRRRTLALVDALDEDEQVRQQSPLMSPVVWDLAHIANYEDLWLSRALSGPNAEPPQHPEYDDLYDAFRHPRADRPSLPILGPVDARAYAAGVRDRVLDRLAGLAGDDPFGPGDDRLLTGAFVYGMVIQHEHQHDETILATRQLMGDRATPPVGTTPAPTGSAAPTGQVEVPGGNVCLGNDWHPWAYDNEAPAHAARVEPFLMDVTPVTNAAFLAFVDVGGYHDERWWTSAGWAWRHEADLVAPQFWQRTFDGWSVLRFGEHLPLAPDEPVQHVCWYEADAYARWAGKRLPTEAEWECAAAWDPAAETARHYPWGDREPTATHANLGQRHRGPAAVGSYPGGVSATGCHNMIGDVWEWTSSDFRPYPGFEPFPYREYSEVFWGAEYKVLRGGSWATDPTAIRNSFRNWDYPIRRQIFAGFRCAADLSADHRSPDER